MYFCRPADQNVSPIIVGCRPVGLSLTCLSPMMDCRPRWLVTVISLVHMLPRCSSVTESAVTTTTISRLLLQCLYDWLWYTATNDWQCICTITAAMCIGLDLALESHWCRVMDMSVLWRRLPDLSYQHPADLSGRRALRSAVTNRLTVYQLLNYDRQPSVFCFRSSNVEPTAGRSHLCDISIPSNVTSKHFYLGNHFRTLLLIDTLVDCGWLNIDMLLRLFT